MATYATWEDLINRYPAMEALGGSAEVNSSYIHGAERELESALGAFYTIPFSSNNYTATDLTLELAYIRYYESVKPDWAEKKMEHFEKRIEKLIAGTMVMSVSSGDAVLSVSNPGGAAMSTTQDYHPTFGVGATIDMLVSSGQLLDEADERGW